MNIKKVSLPDTGQFSTLLLDYIEQKEEARPFYHYYPTIENFSKQIQEKKFSRESRQTLHQVLTEQYRGISPFPQAQIDSLLNENTFTVTTGHQLNIFGGPMYVIYKLITTINLAKQLKAAYPNYNFVPVYWMATEDHDFEEINHFYLFGKKYTWETLQTGAVGRMNPSEIKAIIDQLPESVPLFQKAYSDQPTLSLATRCWVHLLLSEQGLLCLDADDALLKAQFKTVIREDILHQYTSPTVAQTSLALEKTGYKTQINPREINFFYLENGIRERIVRNDGTYEILNTNLSFSEKEIEQLIEDEPEKFSPNVILRPVYQEVVLPNLAYIGGPAEIAYWFQLKDLFDHLNVLFPILLPRNFALVVTNSNARKLEKTGVAPLDLFLEETELKQKFVEQTVSNPVNIQAEVQSIKQAFNSLVRKALPLDKTLEGFIGAEEQKALKSLLTIEKRLKKAEEKNQETGINQLLSLKAKLFPDGSLQERKDNFLNFYLNNPNFLQTLLDNFDPLDFRFLLLIDDDQS